MITDSVPQASVPALCPPGQEQVSCGLRAWPSPKDTLLGSWGALQFVCGCHTFGASSSLSVVPSGDLLNLNQIETGKGPPREIGVRGWRNFHMMKLSSMTFFQTCLWPSLRICLSSPQLLECWSFQIRIWKEWLCGKEGRNFSAKSKNSKLGQ